ncbi:MAG: DUF1275 family protein [Gordonia sp. (in: high G+C Gram-positive bacteria)]
MHRHDLALAVTLAAAAGYLDVIGFIVLSGHFVSFMSGNSTQMATALGKGEWYLVGPPAALVAVFYAGVVLGALLDRLPGGRLTVLGGTFVLVVATAALAVVFPARLPVIIGLPLAMGAVNATFLVDGQTSVGVTYMTGALVKSGQSLVDAMFGGPRFVWLRHLALWSGLAAGGVIGALMHTVVGVPGAIAIDAAVIAVVLAVTAGMRLTSHALG